MRNAQRFDFTEGVDALPLLPLSIIYRSLSVSSTALLDTGVSVNLPYSIGIQLGAVWEDQTTIVTLAGNVVSA